MPSDSLIVEVNPLLLEAMAIPGNSGGVDYFRLLGVPRENLQANAIESAVLKRSKELRPWQNSPDHGDEAIKLLPMFHRIASILKDPLRRGAYEAELDKMLRGEKADPLEEFAEMVRAALADGAIDQASKAELIRYANTNKIPLAEVGRLVKELSATAIEKSTTRPEEDTKWEFKLQEDGPSAFRTHVTAMLARGELTGESSQGVIAEAPKFSLERGPATAILNSLVQNHFERLVKHVAKNGVINNNQARLLMPKAAGLGLPQDKAYQILSAFTFTGASQEDLGTMTLTSASFDQSEIDSLLSEQQTVHSFNRWERLRLAVPSWIGWALLAVIVIGLVVFILPNFVSLPTRSPVPMGGSQSAQPAPAPAGGGAATKPAPTPAVTGTQPTPGAAAATPAPPVVALQEQPDPPSGLLPIKPENPGDPPPFQIKITEVTCREYQKFLLATLYADRPLGWGVDLSFPAGGGDMPVAGVSWKDAVEYCKWLAGTMKLPPDQVRLPMDAEFLRILRAPVSAGRHVSDRDFWNRVGLRSGAVQAPRASKNDTLYLGNGQVYDLIGNLAEWGWDEKGGQRILLGGDFEAGGADFDPRAPRYADPTTKQPKIGFRYVVTGPAPIR